MVQRRMLKEIDAAREKGQEVVVLNVPLLFESAMDALCNETWVMALDKESQVKRVMARDALSREEAVGPGGQPDVPGGQNCPGQPGYSDRPAH